MKVLFVCSGNAFRSPVAEALLKKLKPFTAKINKKILTEVGFT